MRTLTSSSLAKSALTVLVALALAVMLTPVQAHAATVDGTKVSGGAKLYVLKTGKTYKKYDIAGDKKADTVKVKLVETSRKSGVGKAYKIKMNHDVADVDAVMELDYYRKTDDGYISIFSESDRQEYFEARSDSCS